MVGDFSCFSEQEKERGGFVTFCWLCCYFEVVAVVCSCYLDALTIPSPLLRFFCVFLRKRVFALNMYKKKTCSDLFRFITKIFVDTIQRKSEVSNGHWMECRRSTYRIRNLNEMQLTPPSCSRFSSIHTYLPTFRSYTLVACSTLAKKK